MSASLFQNAVDSIRVGMEDYRTNDPARLLSAVRNYHSGISLLAKEVLLRHAVEYGMAVPEDVLAAKYKPVINDEGDIVIVQDGHTTVDHHGLKTRFKEFGIEANVDLLGDLSRVRNQIEHRYTEVPHDALRAVIGQTFPLVQQLFELLYETPSVCLGEAWATMLDLTEFYEAQRKACQATFTNVRWHFPFMSDIEWKCLDCQSPLLAQADAENCDPESIVANCRACGAPHDGARVIIAGLAAHFAADAYMAEKDGGEQPVGICPECAEDAYVTFEVNGCAWCGYVLGECKICSSDLNPNNVSLDDSNLCCSCEHSMSRDD